MLVGNDCYQGRVLNEYNVKDRLLSYWELMRVSDKMLMEYHRGGKSTVGERRRYVESNRKKEKQ